MAEIRPSRRYPHPPARVWTAVASAEGLAAWLMPNDFAPVRGHRFAFRSEPRPGFDGVVRAEVLEIVPPRLLRLAWRGGGLDTTVTFTLSPEGDGTRLDLVHAGFGRRASIAWLVLSLGWRRLLRRVLAAHLREAPAPA